MSYTDKYSWWDDRVTCLAAFSRDKVAGGSDRILSTPKTLYNYFDSEIFGCHEYKKALATAIWSSINLNTKTNFLVIGPSGCGKTELARVFSKVYQNTAVFDATSASPVSFKGHTTIAQSLLDIDTGKEAPPPWLFIDEIDKALLKGDECGDMIMNELLKIMEGGTVYTGKNDKTREPVDTSRVNFVLIGTFAGLKKEQKNRIGFTAGTTSVSSSSPVTRDMLHDSTSLSNELLGRINGGIIEVDPIDKDSAALLLSDPRYSPVNRLQEKYNIEIRLSPGKQDELIGMISKYGVRGIYSELQSRINDALFEDCNIKELTI